MVLAKPFLKWAGGKSQLLEEVRRRLPPALRTGALTRYVEPFVGGGAVFFFIAQRYALKRSDIFDINSELVLTYRVVKENPDQLIEELQALQSEYHGLDSDGQREFYYLNREQFNRTKNKTNFDRYRRNWVEQAARMLFLNRTCYNGLFRVNSRGEFNVPFGKYRKPRILDAMNLIRCSEILANTTIHCGDFSRSARIVGRDTFVYLDPPYRPLSATSSFTSYAVGEFSDHDQERLAWFFRRMDHKGAMLMLSNSDPGNVDPNDDFFCRLYKGFSIERVPARRAISCNGAGRGILDELIITNYR